MNREQERELEYVEDSVTETDKKKEKQPDWEDTIMNRTIYWTYSSDQKENVTEGCCCKDSEEFDYAILLSGCKC